MASGLFDFAVVDREHSALTEGEALAIIDYGAILGLPVLLRTPTLSAGEINRALEAGAAGIQLSQVGSAQEVKELRAACEYAPRGTRSVAVSHPAARYGAVPLRRHVESSAGRPLVIAQLESAMERELYQEILEARPDIAFIGTSDLTVDCRFDRSEMMSRVGAIAEAAAATGTVLGAFGLSDLEQVRYLITSSDLQMLSDGMAIARQHAEGPDGNRKESET